MTIEPLTKWWHLEHSIRMARECLPDQTEGIREEINHPDASYWVALVNGGVKGFAGIKKSGINRHVFEFPWCVVHPDYRGQQIGRALTEIRIAEARRRGAKLVLLSTPVPTIDERYGVRMALDIPGAWANHLMVLKLEQRSSD